MRAQILILILSLLVPSVSIAQFEIVAQNEAPCVFGGEQAVINVTLHNPKDTAAESQLSTRIFQTSSSTVMPVAEAKQWKKLKLFPGQTVIEKITLQFPEVRAVTAFQVCWLDGQNELGRSTVRVAPQNVLKQLGTLVTEKPVGILDPDNQLKPLLEKCQVPFRDLESGEGLADFDGKVVIVGPFTSKESVPQDLTEKISIAAKTSKIPLAIVWAQSPQKASDPLLPVYFVRHEESTVAVVSADYLKNLPQSARSQLNLLQVVQLTLNPEFRLPQTK